jgi:hypothetical protein
MRHFFTNMSLFHGSMIRYGPEVRYSGEKLVLVGLMHESPSQASLPPSAAGFMGEEITSSRHEKLDYLCLHTAPVSIS